MRALIVSAAILMLPLALLGQKIGVLPFEDATGAGEQLGENVAKFIRSELLKDKQFLPKFISYTPGEGEAAVVDAERAVELGKKHGVNFIIIGTILDADVTSKSSGIGGVSILGQSVGSSLRTVSASITLQGDLLSVKDGTIMESFRSEGSDTEASVGADVSTEWGAVNADSNAEQNTPNAKALQDAVQDLVKQIIGHIKGK